jgi:L-fucono-1,5-lactonase
VKVDAHVHVWGPRELTHYTWMTPAMAPIRRPFVLSELEPLLAAHGFSRAILVQTYSSLEETRGLLELAAAGASVAGVVGWVDLASPDVGETLAELQASPGGRYLVGIRHQVHDELDADWLLRDDVHRGLRALQNAGLSYDLLVRTRELPAALRVASAFPELRLVVDHIAKPPIASGELEPWARRLADLAQHPHVSCKLSGLVTEADWARWKPEDLLPYADRVLEWFGEDRVLFGSDWPVCTLAASYEEVVGVAERVAGSSAKVFGENAVTFYALPLAARDG